MRKAGTYLIIVCFFTVRDQDGPRTEMFPDEGVLLWSEDSHYVGHSCWHRAKCMFVVLTGEVCHCASFSQSLLSFFTSVSLPSTQLPYLLSHFTRSQPMTRQLNTIILVQYGLAIRGGLQGNLSRLYVVPRTVKDRSSIVLSLNEIPHRIKQVTLGRSLPGSQCLFPLELEVHLS